MIQNQGEKYHTWLLIQEQPNNQFRKVLERDWEYQNKLDMEARVPVVMGLKDNKPYLCTADSDKLIEEIYRNKKEVRAFSFAPSRQLEKLHGRVFSCNRMSWFKVLWDGANKQKSKNKDPYYRRFVTLEYLSSAPASSLDNKENTALDVSDDFSLARNLPRLIIRPESISLPAELFNVVFQNLGKPFKTEGMNTVVLPPVRSTSPKQSYFSDTQTGIREAMADFFAHPSTSLPAIVSTWYFMNDPLVRDILLDGGSVRLSKDKALKTSIELNFSHDDAEKKLTGTDWYRMKIFRDAKEELPQWAKNLGFILKDDLKEIVNRYITFGTSNEKMSWKTNKVNVSGYGPLEGGTWELFHKFKKLFTVSSQKADFDTYVTFPSAARAKQGPNNEMAEKLFAMNFFHCPWEQKLGDQWKRAMLEIIEETVEKQSLSSTERIIKWQQMNAEHALDFISNKNNNLNISYSPYIEEEDLDHWSLMLPLGTSFSPRVALKLNRSTAQLDSGFHLGG